MCEKEQNIHIMLGADRALRLNDQPNTVYDELQKKYFKRFLQTEWGHVYKSIFLQSKSRRQVSIQHLEDESLLTVPLSKRKRLRLLKLLTLRLFNGRRNMMLYQKVFQFMPKFNI